MNGNVLTFMAEGCETVVLEGRDWDMRLIGGRFEEGELVGSGQAGLRIEGWAGRDGLIPMSGRVVEMRHTVDGFESYACRGKFNLVESFDFPPVIELRIRDLVRVRPDQAAWSADTGRSGSSAE